MNELMIYFLEHGFKIEFSAFTDPHTGIGGYHIYAHNDEIRHYAKESIISVSGESMNDALSQFNARMQQLYDKTNGDV